MACWKSLRFQLRMFLYAVSGAIDILVEHFSSLDLTKVKSKRVESFTVGCRDPDFLFINVCELQTKREIKEPKRFLYSKATMEPDAIESEDKFHAELEGAYRTVMQDPVVSDECKKCFTVALNYHQNKRQKTG